MCMCVPLVVDWTTNYTAGLRQQVSRMKEKKKTIHASFLATIIVNTRVKKKKKKRKTVKIVSEKGLKKRGHAKRKRKKKIPNESTTKKNFAYFETPH